MADKEIVIFIGIITFIIVFGILYSSIVINTSKNSKFSCQTDDDCTCGVDIATGECAFGNKKYINSSIQCPDFCSGIHGRFQIKCINKTCSQIFVS